MKFFKRYLAVIGLVSLLCLVVLATVFWQIFRPVDPSQVKTTRFTIPKGQAVITIGQRLTEAKFIRHPLVFRYIVWKNKLSNKIQAGSFELSGAMTAQEVAETLTKGTNDLWITVVEGWRVEEIADMLDRQELDEFDKQAFLDLAKKDQGYLFPDTYLVPRLSTSQQLYSIFKNTFDKKVTQGLATQFSQTELSSDQVITLASIVQREGRGAEEMRQIAGVLLKRMDIGMALQVDASLQYIKGYNAVEKSWWVQPLGQDRELKSPYNTYLNPGLPPGPICNPGLDAIKAVLNPVMSNNLFYLHDSKGVVHFAVTLDEHNQNVEKYLR